MTRPRRVCRRLSASAFHSLPAAFASSVHRWRRVERRQVLPAGRAVAHSRQVPTGRTFRLQQAPVVGPSFNSSTSPDFLLPSLYSLPPHYFFVFTKDLQRRRGASSRTIFLSSIPPKRKEKKSHICLISLWRRRRRVLECYAVTSHFNALFLCVCVRIRCACTRECT